MEPVLTVNAEAESLERRLVLATQGGMPLCEKPYHRLAEELGATPEAIKAIFQRMLTSGQIRRIGAVPNHYRIGYTANGMSVWDVPDEYITQVGEELGALDIVSHCYQRPRQLPDWPFNLFAMVHGHSEAEVRELVSDMATHIGDRCRDSDVLFSTEILKKTGLRLRG